MTLFELGAMVYSSIGNIGLSQNLVLHCNDVKSKLSEIFFEGFGEIESSENPEILGKIDIFLYEFEILKDLNFALVSTESLLPGSFGRTFLEGFSEGILEFFGESIPSEEEIQKQIRDLTSQGFDQLQRLLQESNTLSQELGYDILSFVILITGEFFGVGEFIKNNGIKIEQYSFVSPSDFKTNYILARLRDEEKKKTGCIEGKNMINTGKILRGLSLLKKEVVQGNMYAAFEIGKYYESINHPDTQRYLNYACISGVGDALLYIGKKISEDQDGLSSTHDYNRILQIGSYQFASLDCFRAYMNDFSNRREKKKSLKQLIQEDRIINPDWKSFIEYKKQLQSNKWNIKLSDCNTRIRLKYKKYALEFCKRLQRTFGIEYHPDLILESLSFSFMDDSFSDPAGDYSPRNGNIRIDYFFHVDGGLIENPETFKNFFGTFCHEAIHKVSIEASQEGLKEFPRFMNEGLTSSVEELLSGYDPKSYDLERNILKKLLELSGEDKMNIYNHFINGNFRYIIDVFSPHLSEILEIFAENKDFNGENNFLRKIMGPSQFNQSLMEEVTIYRDLVQSFQTFGLRISATQDELKEAYRKGVKENHPDVGGDETKMTQINIAKDIIYKHRRWS